jgi:hypothetical protein
LEQGISTPSHPFWKLFFRVAFHVEPDSETWSSWREHLPKQLAEEDDLRRNRVAELRGQLIARFFDIALSPGISLHPAGKGQ